MTQMPLAPPYNHSDNPDGSLVIWQIVDGKPGHENQSGGLIMALKEKHKCYVEQVPVRTYGVTWPQYLLGRYRFHHSWQHPHLVIGAGSRTHPTILAASRAMRAAAIVLMSPPRIFQPLFDLCITPEHDKRRGHNVITTKGAINTIRPSHSQSPERGLFLIGGPSKHHGWHEGLLLKQIETILTQNPEIRWKLTTSRRTPESTLGQLQSLKNPNLAIYPVDKTPQGWVAKTLAESGNVWATEDSVSMVYEALSSGARVGLLQVPRLTQNSRVLRGLDDLIEKGLVQPYERSGAKISEPSRRFPLNEADRIASIIETRFLS